MGANLEKIKKVGIALLQPNYPCCLPTLGEFKGS